MYTHQSLAALQAIARYVLKPASCLLDLGEIFQTLGCIQAQRTAKYLGEQFCASMCGDPIWLTKVCRGSNSCLRSFLVT